MATESIVLAASEVASTDLSASQYCFVTFDSNGQVALPSAGALAIGVLQDNPKAQSQVCSVCRAGDRTTVVYGGAVSKGARVTTDNAGKCVAATSGDEILGVNRDQTGVLNHRGTILFQPSGRM